MLLKSVMPHVKYVPLSKEMAMAAMAERRAKGPRPCVLVA